MKKEKPQTYKIAKTKDVIKAMEECTEKYSKALSNLAKK